jgi:hypothetical protein
MRYLIVVTLLFVAGCPVRVSTPTGDVCPAKPNCGQCVAMAPCAWCTSANGSLRGCFAKGHRSQCDAPVVEDAVEACPEDATGHQ